MIKKKKSSEILADERSQEIFRETVKLSKMFRKSENFSEIGGKSETGGENALWSQGEWTPLIKAMLKQSFNSIIYCGWMNFEPMASQSSKQTTGLLCH